MKLCCAVGCHTHQEECPDLEFYRIPAERVEGIGIRRHMCALNALVNARSPLGGPTHVATLFTMARG